MYRDPNEKAIAAQLERYVPNDGISEPRKGKGLTDQQIWRPIKRMEAIMVELIDSKTRAQKKAQKKKRKRRRGPKVLVANL